MLLSLKVLVLFEGLVFSLKVGRYILCDSTDNFATSERAEFTTQQMLSNKFPVAGAKSFSGGLSLSQNSTDPF